jgi:hypothetical protein
VNYYADGVRIEQITNAANYFLVDYISDIFQKDPDSISLFFQNQIGHDDYRGAEHHDIYRCGNQLFHKLSSDNTEDDILSVIKESKELIGDIGLILKIKSDKIESFIDFKNELSKEGVRQLINHVTHIVFGVYDGESFVIWKKENRKS